jgi:hypothetical protein
MHRSFRDWLKELASAASLTEDQLLKAAGVILLLRHYSGPPAKPLMDGEDVMSILKQEKVARPEELQERLGIGAGELRAALQNLKDKGEVVFVDTSTYGRLVALADDGTLKLRQLSDDKRTLVASAAYANKKWGATYRSLLEAYGEGARIPEKEAADTREKVLELLRAGPKRYVELVRSGVPKSRIYPALKELIKEGKVRKVKRGKYAVA